MIAFYVVFMLLTHVWAEETMEETHVHIEDGVVFCDVQSFEQEAYILKVIGSGSPMTVFWQFDVLEQRKYWLDKEVARVRLGRQVIPDLVTQRWLLRDLSGGVIKHTNDAHEAMHFLTNMRHIAVVDVSVLEPSNTYTLDVHLFIYEGEGEHESWLSLFSNAGFDMGSVPLHIDATKQQRIDE